MTSSEIRGKYLKFFEERGHTVIPAAPLVLEHDPTTLFTSSGMQPLVPYLKGERDHPAGKRLVNSQPCFRAEDIEEVGDNRHTTFFEMLGNWSLGDYFKKEQLEWIWDFFTKELKLSRGKLYVSVFEGGAGVPKDTETYEIWREIGVAEDHINFYGADKNWWSRSGPPGSMAAGDIGGPDSEVFYDFGTPHDPAFGAQCHPSCQCGRFLEIGNSVFIQYKKEEDGSLEELAQKNVDFGGGLERLTATTEGVSDIFKTDLYLPIIKVFEEWFGESYEESKESARSFRILADHLKATVVMASYGVSPSNKMQGYVMRRLIRRAMVMVERANIQETLAHVELTFVPFVVGAVASIYQDVLPRINEQKSAISKTIEGEVNKFQSTLERGMYEIGKLQEFSGKVAFDLYQTYGFPLELTEELVQERGLEIDKEEFYSEFEKHRQLSRTASAGMFKGGLAATGEQETKYHTATHLLHQALRTVLGDHVIQRGSNITSERLRFDFSHPEKLTNEQIKKLEDLVNEQIEKHLSVSCEEMGREEALASGAIGAFGERYGDRVKVYKIGNFSKEICGGPHVTNTAEIGRVTITKEESAGSGIRRIYAQLD